MRLKHILRDIRGFLRAPKEKAFYGQFVGAKKLFFDIGANVGDRAAIFLSLGVSVVCVEPQKKCADALALRFKGNPKVFIENIGLDSAPGIRKMHICDDADTLSTFSDEWQEGRFSAYSFDAEEQVKMGTLEDLVQKYGIPDFCKIDVEGFEYQVVSGLRTKIPCLNFEYTSEYIANAEKCIDALTQIGFGSFNFTVGESTAFSEERWMTADAIKEKIHALISQDSDLWGDIYAK